MHPLPYNSALPVIDVQDGFDEPVWGGNRSNPRMEENVARLPGSPFYLPAPGQFHQCRRPHVCLRGEVRCRA